MGYGDRLRRIRLSLGMDQREFAASIQMVKGTYAHHELSTYVRRGGRQIANSIELRHQVPAWWTLGSPPPEGVVVEEAPSTGLEPVTVRLMDCLRPLTLAA